MTVSAPIRFMPTPPLQEGSGKRAPERGKRLAGGASTWRCPHGAARARPSTPATRGARRHCRAAGFLNDSRSKVNGWLGSPAGAEDEAEDFGVGVEALHQDLALLRLGRAVQAHVRVCVQVEEGLRGRAGGRAGARDGGWAREAQARCRAAVRAPCGGVFVCSCPLLCLSVRQHGKRNKREAAPHLQHV